MLISNSKCKEDRAIFFTFKLIMSFVCYNQKAVG